MDKSIKHFYWTMYDGINPPVDILRVDIVLLSNPSKLAYKVSHCKNAVKNYNEACSSDVRVLSQLCVPYDYEDLPVCSYDFPKFMATILPPKSRSDIDSILASVGMTYYDPFELLSRIGHISPYSYKVRSVYNDKYYGLDSRYLVERWLTADEVNKYMSSIPKFNGGCFNE